LNLRRISWKKLAQIDDPQAVHFVDSRTKLIEMPVAGVSVPVMLQTAAVAGMQKELIVVADRDQLKTFTRETLRPLQVIRAPMPVLQIAVSPFDSSVFAAASLTEVFVFATLSNGGVEMLHKIELMLSTLGPSLYVAKIEWVPLAPLHLAVTTPSFVKVYDVPIDCISPAVCFQPSEKIASSFLAVQNDAPFLVIGTASGKVAVVPCPSESNGPIAITKWLEVPKISVASYSEESGIVFGSSGRATLFGCWIDSFFSGRPITNYTMLVCRGQPLENPVVFACCHPTIPTIHFLRSLNNGNVYMMEITSRGIDLSPIDLPVDGPILSLFPCDDTVAAVLSNGRLYQLAPGKDRGDFSVHIAEEPFSVPPTFWSRATLEKKAVSIIDEKGTDFSTHRRGRIKRQLGALTVRSTDSSRVVVGVTVGLQVTGPASAPEWIQVANRRIPCGQALSRQYSLALRPSEVGQPMVVEIKSAGTEIILDALHVYVVPASDLPARARDWALSATDIRDFHDSEDEPFANEHEFIIATISTARFAHIDDRDEAALLSAIRMMYTQSRIAKPLRRMVLKAAAGANALGRIWAQAIRDVCADGSVDKEMVGLLWRDYALLEPKDRNTVGDAIWAVPEAGPGVWSVVSSLLA
jgi:hypothetical protein